MFVPKKRVSLQNPRLLAFFSVIARMMVLVLAESHFNISITSLDTKAYLYFFQ